MKLDRPFGPPEPGPVEHRRAEVDGGGIEREQFASEPKLVPWCDGVATRVQALKRVPIQLPRPMSVRVRQRGALGPRVHAELLEPPLGACQTLLDLTQ